ncbi:hypothetical protein PAPYR_5311 [Paratrimastix pyriformis]|uniref:Uncharacterized protein n=1 Tax=Paratrimastix pyriformis TaxID=342808 RepID=A0ABQ8UJ23_9EUKA|nr:hypothetical protein PAPYR_5311 [Paratrimastix pyriformis]
MMEYRFLIVPGCRWNGASEMPLVAEIWVISVRMACPRELGRLELKHENLRDLLFGIPGQKQKNASPSGFPADEISVFDQ